MSEQPQSETQPVRGGDRRADDRRGGSRRQRDRRTPPPPWRRPWAYVAYGTLGALLLTFALTRLGDDDEEPGVGGLETTTAQPAVDTLALPASQAPVQDATTVGAFERLLAQGEAAAGQRVRTVLYCGAITQINLHTQERTSVPPSVAALADAGGRVPGAECQWGADPGAPNFLLLVPAGLAERFAAVPEVELGFVRRRRATVEVEWIGRSEALAVRNVGVLRAVL